MKNVIIFGANGQIARLVEQRLLSNKQDLHLTLFLRNAHRLDFLKNNPRVTIIDGDLKDKIAVEAAMKDQNIAFIAVVDHDANNSFTNNVIAGAKANGTTRIIATNVLGIYDEVPGEFGRWNAQMISKAGMFTAKKSDQLLAASGLNYTTLRLPWLNNRNDLNYELTHKNEEYVGVSVSRKSVVDLVVRIINDPAFLANDSVGIADPATQGLDRPVY